MHYRKIIVPLDSSYREYDKFEAAFSDSEVWKHFVFVCDIDIDINPNGPTVVKIDTSKYSLNDFSEVFNRVSPTGKNFTDFCSIDLMQNRGKYSNSAFYLNFLRLKFLALIDILEEYQDSIIIYNSALHFFPRATAHIGRYLGMEVYSYVQSIVPAKEFIWIDDAETFRCDNLTEKFQFYLKEPNSLQARFQGVKESVISGKLEKTYLSGHKHTFISRLKRLISIRNRFFHPNYYNLNRLLGFLDKFIFRQIRSILWKRAASLDYEGDFVFFPLHMPNESTTIVRSYPFHDDLEVLYKLSREMPEGVTIIAKEHPGYEGWISLADLKKLKSMPNVRLVESDISSHELIKKCSSVITLNSSLWFETIFFDKPCITFGRGFFTDFDIVHEVDSIESCKQTYGKLSKVGFHISETQGKNRRAFVAAYDDVSVQGRMYEYDKNAQNAVTNMLKEKVEEL